MTAYFSLMKKTPEEVRDFVTGLADGAVISGVGLDPITTEIILDSISDKRGVFLLTSPSSLENIYSVIKSRGIVDVFFEFSSLNDSELNLFLDNYTRAKRDEVHLSPFVIITDKNYKKLPQFMKSLFGKIKLNQVLFRHGSLFEDKTFPKYAEVDFYLATTVKYLLRKNVKISIAGFPFCYVAEFVNLSEEISRTCCARVYAPVCKYCTWKGFCKGIPANYESRLGVGEIFPVFFSKPGRH